MKAVVLAAGRGKRLRPLTDHWPKALLPVAGTTLLEHNLERVREAGVGEAVIVIDDDTGKVIPEIVGDGHNRGLSLTYAVQSQPLGTAHALRFAQPYVEDGPFVVVFGDNLSGFPLRRLLDAHRAGTLATLTLKRVTTPRDFGTARVNADHVIRVDEHPSEPGEIILAGMYLFESSIWGIVDGIGPSADGEYLLPDAIQRGLESGHAVSCCWCEEWRMNINSPDDLLKGNARLLEVSDLRAIASSVTLRSSHGLDVLPPVWISPLASVAEGVCLGPFVTIREGCRLETRARVSNSILLSGVHVGAGAQVTGCILGRGVCVPPGRTVHAEKDSMIVVEGRMVA